MKLIKEFYEFTGLKQQQKKVCFLLIIASFLYCVSYMGVMNVVYQSSSSLWFYLGIYIIVLFAALGFMYILHQFMHIKRKDRATFSLKAICGPVLCVQTIFYFALVGMSFLSFSVLMRGQMQVNAFVITPVMMVLMLCYIPLQVFCFYYIYDGLKNPLIIIGKSFRLIIKHYQSVFYSLLPLFLVAVIFQSCLSIFFNLSNPFMPNSAIVSLLTESNPFMTLFELIGFVFENSAFLLPVLLSFVYGCVMCYLLSIYYMLMAAIFDEDIHV